MVCSVVVTKVARDVLDGPSQMVFFQSMGRRYSVVGTTVVARGRHCRPRERQRATQPRRTRRRQPIHSSAGEQVL